MTDGLLGASPAANSEGLLGRFSRFSNQHPMALMGLASGLLSNRRSNSEAFAAGLDGFRNGILADLIQRDRVRKREKEEHRRQSASAYADELGLSGTAADFYSHNPGALSTYALERSKPQRKSAAREQYDMLIASGVDPQTAYEIVGRRRRVSRDPVSQRAQIVDMATGEVIGDGQQPAATATVSTDPYDPSGEGLYQQADDAVGAIPTIAEGLSGIAGQISPDWVGRDAVAARQSFRLAENELIRAMSLNPRFPVAEQQRIRGLMPGTGPLSAPETARVRMKQLDAALERSRMTQEAVSRDPTMPVQDRRTAMSTISAIDRFRAVLNVPPASRRGQSQRRGVGKTVTLNGKSYARGPDGRWMALGGGQ